MALLIGGCGELSYKRGASPGDLDLARRACESAGSEKAVDRCLQDHGWVVKKLDDRDLFAVAGVTSDHRNPPTSAGGRVSEAAGAEQAAAASPKAGGASAGQGTPPPPASPLDVYTVTSWWKVGAGRENQEADTNDCVGQLGKAHQPHHATQQVTRGFVVCMHAKGWKALRPQ